jgi:hypothetical protein
MQIMLFAFTFNPLRFVLWLGVIYLVLMLVLIAFALLTYICAGREWFMRFDEPDFPRRPSSMQL